MNEHRCAWMRAALATALALAISLPARADHLAADGWAADRPDSHAPIGVMADHIHTKGQWMLSYRVGFMSMEGNRTGTASQSEEEVLADYMVAPRSMTMWMQMFGLMVAPSDHLTLMAMVPWQTREMDHVTRMGAEFTARTSGISDASLSALVRLGRFGQQQVHATVGVQAPTGSIDERGDTPAGPDQQLPYPMQTGSGTWDLLLGLTWIGQAHEWSWGSQVSGVVRTGRNDREYRLGDRVELNAWGALSPVPWLSFSLRGTGSSWGNITGEDAELNPMMVPTADPSLRGGSRLDFGFGANLLGTSGMLAGQRLGLEFILPAWQKLDGPQLETDWRLIAGWQRSFG